MNHSKRKDYNGQTVLKSSLYNVRNVIFQLKCGKIKLRKNKCLVTAKIKARLPRAQNVLKLKRNKNFCMHIQIPAMPRNSY